MIARPVGCTALGWPRVAASAAACSPATSSDGRPQVVATTTQVGEVAGELGGDAIELVTLLPPGAEAHDFEMTTDDARAIERAT